MSCEQSSWIQRLRGVFFEQATLVNPVVGMEEFEVRMGQLEAARDIQKESLQMTVLKTTEMLRREPTRLVELNPHISTVIIPDLHTRRDFLGNVLAFRMNSVRVLDALEQGKINVVCLGDGMHSENPIDWKGDHREELVRSLNLMQMVMELRLRFPNNFHYLRGNHDDVKNEGLKKWDIPLNTHMQNQMRAMMGARSVDAWHQFEQQLPLMALLRRNDGGAVIMTHAAPADKVTPAKMSTKPLWSRNDQLFFDLTWTENMPERKLIDPDHWVEPWIIKRSILDTAEAFGLDSKRLLWVVGHRNVEEMSPCRIQCDGQLVQIASSYRQLIYPIPVFGSLHPRNDIMSLNSH